MNVAKHDTAAPARYRDLLAGLQDAAEQLAADEQARAAALAAQEPHLAATMYAAGELQTYVRRVVQSCWRRAHSDILWRETSWLTRRDDPVARPGMHPDDLDGFEQDIAGRLVDLERVRRRRIWELFSR